MIFGGAAFQAFIMRIPELFRPRASGVGGAHAPIFAVICMRISLQFRHVICFFAPFLPKMLFRCVSN